MTDTTLNQGTIQKKGWAGESSGWMKRAVLVTFCALLIGTLGVVFTRVVAARVPEQRATLEKLIADRTGLAVRFDNVHFAWNLDGTSAVFERVELTDPKRGRVRVVAPELRVEFDTWDYLRHHEFSLGHVTLSSPDIEIIGDTLDIPATAAAPRAAARAPAHTAADDEGALVRRFTAWADLMPNGRIEVEGARVHLLRRGDRGARTTFTLSQAVLSRGAGSFNAFGTMLLSQDVGQSLFVSAKLEGLGDDSGVSGDLRVIARRVFLDKLPTFAGVTAAARGRGTLDATLRLSNGHIESGRWKASARDIEIGEDQHGRFDHFTVDGKLERNADDFVLRFADLQLTRGARLERAPNLVARVRLERGTTRIVRTTVSAERVPFMAVELMAELLSPNIDRRMLALRGGWRASAGELRAVRFDSGAGAQHWSLSAQLTGAELARAADHTRIDHVAASLQVSDSSVALTFDPANSATLHLGGVAESRPINLDGRLVVLNAPGPASFRFEDFRVSSDATTVAARGEWSALANPLTITIANLDRAQLRDGWSVLAQEIEVPALLADIQLGQVVEGTLNVLPLRDASGQRGVNWLRSKGTLKLAELAVAGDELPSLSAGRGTLEFTRGNTRLMLDGGEIDELAITSARVDWPLKGAPRLQAALQGELTSPLLRRSLQGQGLERLTGMVTVDADARGERALRAPDLWRVTAQLTNASLPLADDLPPVEKLAGTVRYSSGQLRGLALSGTWLGGPIQFESRRVTTRGNLNVGISGVADAAPLLRLLGQPETSGRINGQLSWTGSAQRQADGWQLALASNLAGVESRLPEPFAKSRARALPVSAQLRIDAKGVREFTVDGRDLAIQGVIVNGVTTADFKMQGVAGEWRRTAADDVAQLKFERLDLKRAPTVLASAGAMLPADGEIAMTVDDMRHADLSLGTFRATLARREAGVEFSLESAESAPHQLTVHGLCASVDARCSADFTADSQQLEALLREAQLPPEWPTRSLHAKGKLTWPGDSQGDLTRLLAGRFEFETQGTDSSHQLLAHATLADGQIELTNVQGTGPEADQMFRGSGRVGLVAREYDLMIDYERVSLAASAVPTPARARLARALTALRGSVARRGWTEPPEARRVQWHGTWH